MDFSRLFLASCLFAVAGCANQLQLGEQDCALTLLELDASVSSSLIGTADGEGCMLISRGDCPALERVVMATGDCSVTPDVSE